MFLGKHMRISPSEEGPVPKDVAARLLPVVRDDLVKVGLLDSRGHVG